MMLEEPQISLEDTYRQNRIKKVVRHSLLTQMSGDIVGFALTEYSIQERQLWLNKNKDEIPPHKRITFFNKKSSFNFEFLLLLMEFLMEFQPIDHSDLTTVKTELTLWKKHYTRYPRIMVTDYAPDKLLIRNTKRYKLNDNGLGIIVAYATAYYSKLLNLDMDYMYELNFTIGAQLGFTEEEYNITNMLSTLVYGLIESGYLAGVDLQKLVDLDLVSSGMRDFISMSIENSDSVEYLKLPFITDVSTLSYSELLIAQALFYTQRHWASNEPDFKKLPKEQLTEVYLGRLAPADMGFMYGGLASVSDHLYKLFSVNIISNAPYLERVEEVLRYC